MRATIHHFIQALPVGMLPFRQYLYDVTTSEEFSIISQSVYDLLNQTQEGYTPHFTLQQNGDTITIIVKREVNGELIQMGSLDVYIIDDQLFSRRQHV